jgi:hypothetical protein
MRTDGRTEDETKLTDAFRDYKRKRLKPVYLQLFLLLLLEIPRSPLGLYALNVSASQETGLFKESECTYVKCSLSICAAKFRCWYERISELEYFVAAKNTN